MSLMPQPLQIQKKVKKSPAMQKSCLVIRIKTHKLRESKRFSGYCGIQRRTLLFFGLDISLILQRNYYQHSLIKVIASVYDPIGFISPFIIPMKILFQDLCSEKEDWDSPLSAEHLKRWQNWITELSKVQEVRVPRFCSVNHVTSVELHSFSDASIKAFAAAVYLRLESEDKVATTLVASKTRVAPLKQQSLPRLELLGALISSRLASAVERAVSSCIIINSVYCWTDSITALFWINGVDKEFKQFVENRVAGIRKRQIPVYGIILQGRIIHLICQQEVFSWVSC